MSGRKGRSGRRTKVEELDIHELTKICKGHLLMRMRDASTPDDIKDKIALMIAPRLISNDVNISIALPHSDAVMLDKYSIAVPDNRLAQITGQTEQAVHGDDKIIDMGTT